MKYLSVIYYDKFARFFCAIEDAVKDKDPDAEFLHLAIFPSGWVYMKVHQRNVKLLPWQIRKSSPINVDANIDELDRITHYHSIIGKRYGEEQQSSLRLRAQAYINTMGHFIESFQPDAVLFSGDTRIASESLRFYLDKSNYSGKRYFFEQGPNGTTIFDTRGVNANCSFRESAAGLTGVGYSAKPPIRQEKFKRNPLYRASDHALIGALRLLGSVPAEWDCMSFTKYPESDYRQCVYHGSLNTHPEAKEILVALQVPDDANNIHHNPLELGDVELVRMVLSALGDKSYPVRVREHPLYKRRYTGAMYDLLQTSDHALLSDASLADDLAKAIVVVTVNSMTGLDAYLRKIPVAVLGNSFYDHIPGIVRATDITSLKNVILSLSDSDSDSDFNSKLGELDPSSIFAEMSSRYFIQGHYEDASLDGPASCIAKILLQDLLPAKKHCEQGQ